MIQMNTRALVRLSPSDVALRRDYVCRGLYNWPYTNWSVATNPCSLHVQINTIIIAYECPISPRNSCKIPILLSGVEH